MHHPTRLLAYGFIVILIMMVFLAIIGFYTNQSNIILPGYLVTKQLEKIELIRVLSSNIDSRTRFLQSLLITQKALDSDAIWKDFDQFTLTYSNAHRLLKDISSSTEREYILAIDKSVEAFNNVSRQALILLLSGNQMLANATLLDEVFPASTLVLDQIGLLNQQLGTELNQRMQQVSNDAERDQTQFAIYAIVTLIISMGIALFAIWYNQNLSTRLEDINTYLEDKVNERTESLLDTQKELMEDNSELARLASTDNLTGLSNRAFMSEILEKEYSRYQRHHQLFGLIMLDIDHFKKINDDYGHDIGDRVLIQLARQLEQAVRNSDYTSRWGGEEFLICCTTIQQDDLLSIAETIRQKIAHYQFEIDEGITASLGCAIIEPGEKIEDLIKRADVALYAAKNNGRNQTIVSEFNEFV